MRLARSMLTRWNLAACQFMFLMPVFSKTVGLAKVILLLREDLKKNGVLHAIFNAMSAVARLSGHLRTSQVMIGRLGRP